MGAFRRASLLLCLFLSAGAHAQRDAKTSPFNPRQQWSAFAEYGPISGHYFPDGGDVAHHDWLAVGAGSRWRMATFWGGSLSYVVELRPVAVTRQTVATVTTTVSGFGAATSSEIRARCVAGTSSYNFSGATFSQSVTCNPEWVYGEQLAPVGLQENFHVRARVQPILTVNGGYLFSTQQIPNFDSGNFHFTISVGAGVEYYLQGKQAMSFEVRDLHYSNAYTAPTNYGTDNIVLHAAYHF